MEAARVRLPFLQYTNNSVINVRDYESNEIEHTFETRSIKKLPASVPIASALSASPQFRLPTAELSLSRPEADFFWLH